MQNEWTLVNVRHVPSSKRNLISLGKLLKEGYVFKGHGYELKFVWCFMVCFKIEFKNGIYLLKGVAFQPIITICEAESESKI